MPRTGRGPPSPNLITWHMLAETGCRNAAELCELVLGFQVGPQPNCVVDRSPLSRRAVTDPLMQRRLDRDVEDQGSLGDTLPWGDIVWHSIAHRRRPGCPPPRLQLSSCPSSTRPITTTPSQARKSSICFSPPMPSFGRIEEAARGALARARRARRTYA